MDYSNIPENLIPLYRLIFKGIIPILLVGLPILIVAILVFWKIYKKAGKPGWTSLVPIYNNIILFKIAGLPIWYFILSFIPIVNIYIAFKLNIELSHKFGKSTGFGVAMVFFPVICLPILAFSKKAIYDSGENTSNEHNPYQPQQNYNIPNNGMNNIQMATVNNMPQPAPATPVETAVAPQTPVENITPVQAEPVINQEPVFVEQPVVNNTQMAAVNSMPQPAPATPVETPVAPQMPVENITPVQPQPVINQEPVFVEQPVVNNNQNGGIM